MMAKSLNQCNFIGNLTRDIEIRYAPSGAVIGGGALACNNTYKNKTTGEVVEEVEFVNLTFFGKSAEIAEKWLKKGSKIHVSGRMKTDKYDDKEGITRYSTKIIVNDFLMLDGRGSGESHDSGGNQGSGGPSSTQSAPQSQAAPAPANNDFDDDIPF